MRRVKGREVQDRSEAEGKKVARENNREERSIISYKFYGYL